MRVRIQPTLAGNPILLDGDGASAADRRNYQLTTVRFFVAGLTLRRAGQPDVRADLIDAVGKPLPYGVQLIDLETPDSLDVRLRVPPGTYDGVSATIGLPTACNRMNPADALAPLNSGSGMTWTWQTGYLFMRVEGRRQAATQTTWESFAAHGGGLGGAAPLQAAAAMIAATGPAMVDLRLNAQLDEALAAIMDRTDLMGGEQMISALRADPSVFLKVAPQP